MRNTRFLPIIFVCGLLIFFSPGLRAQGSGLSPQFLKLVREVKKEITEIDPSVVGKKIKEGANIILIDVREKEEWPMGHIAGAINITKGVLERDISSVTNDLSAEIIVYCSSSARSSLAAFNLKKMGYMNVFSMTGGIQKWREQGFKTVQ